MLQFLSSIKNAIWFIGLVMVFLFIGTLVIPNNMLTYTDILDTLLITWITKVDLSISWWVVGIILSLGLVGLSTAISSFNSLRTLYLSRRLTLKNIAPHICHLGILIMLMGHAIGAVSGIRVEGTVAEGDVFAISDEISYSVENITIEASPGKRDFWQIRGTWIDKGIAVKQGIVLPARPAFYKGIWLFIHSTESETGQAYIIGRGDWGVFFLFAGGVVFLAGCIINLRGKREESMTFVTPKRHVRHNLLEDLVK